MKKQILFIQGGGESGYETDIEMMNSLQKTLEKDYTLHYPQLETDKAASDFGWLKQIQDQISKYDNLFLVAHSLGASMVLKCLSEHVHSQEKLAGVFLLATPFWNGEEKWKQGLKLQSGFAQHLSQDIPFFFYHCLDDKEVPFDQLAKYQQVFPQATYREIEFGGHQFGNNLAFVAEDIKLIA